MLSALVMMVYAIYNTEYLKTDPCSYCVEETGAQCYRPNPRNPLQQVPIRSVEETEKIKAQEGELYGS